MRNDIWSISQSCGSSLPFKFSRQDETGCLWLNAGNPYNYGTTPNSDNPHYRTWNEIWPYKFFFSNAKQPLELIPHTQPKYLISTKCFLRDNHNCVCDNAAIKVICALQTKKVACRRQLMCRRQLITADSDYRNRSSIFLLLKWIVKSYSVILQHSNQNCKTTVDLETKALLVKV